MSYSKGQVIKACIPFSEPETSVVHIDHVLPSYYEGKSLIVYSVYGKHKQYWHEFMCYDHQMDAYVKQSKT